MNEERENVVWSMEVATFLQEKSYHEFTGKCAMRKWAERRQRETWIVAIHAASHRLE